MTHRYAYIPSGLLVRVLTLSLLFVVCSSDAAAQQVRSQGGAATSGTIGVQARIGQVLSLIGTNDLSFGQIAATNGFTTTLIDRSSPDAGQFEVRGSGDNDIRVTYVAPTQLVNESGAGVIGVNLHLFGTPVQGNASSAERLLQNETVSLSGGRYFFFLGGELNVGPLNSNPPGIYVGEFELEVSYLDL